MTDGDACTDPRSRQALYGVLGSTATHVFAAWYHATADADRTRFTATDVLAYAYLGPAVAQRDIHGMTFYQRCALQRY